MRIGLPGVLVAVLMPAGMRTATTATDAVPATLSRITCRLALREGASRPAQLTGGFGLSGAVPLDGRIEESFGRQLEALPAQTRRLVQLAAADPSGDPVLVWRAAGRLAIGAGAAGPAVEAGLAEFGARVRFRHPLVRSAAYRSASVQTRQELHGALAEVTDPAADPDRRAWHRAQAAPGPDEEVAAELEQSAGRAQRRGGLAAAAAFLERSAGLTLDPARRAQRALAAAQAKHRAGALDAALGLLAMAQAGPLDELQRARGDLLRAQIAFASSHGRDAPPLMLRAARQLEALDVGLARDTYLEAFTAAIFVGRLSPAVDGVARAARNAPAPPAPARAADLLLDGLALLITEGYAAGTPALKRALLAFRSQGISAEEGLSWLWLAGRAAMAVWDDETWHTLASRHVKLARDTGALSELPLAVRSRILLHAHAGELEEGAALIAEAQAVADTTGSQLGPYGALGIAAFRGREAEATELIRATMDGVTSRGEGRGVTSQYSAALLYNGLGHYDKALAAAELMCGYDDLGVFGWSLTELVEAAVRSGQPARAFGALQQLSEMTRASGTDWALGTEARSRALLSEGQTAENSYREAIERLRPYPHAPGPRPRPPPVRRMAAPREPAPRRPHPAADRLRHAVHHGSRGIRRTGPARTAGHRRHSAQAAGRDGQRAHRAGAAHRPARRRRPHQRGDRRPALPQHPDRRMAPGQGVHQAPGRLTARAAAGPGQRRAGRPTGLATGGPDPNRPRQPGQPGLTPHSMPATCPPGSVAAAGYAQSSPAQRRRETGFPGCA
jgi:tetratricopeptide (TPR) repeat protein